MKKFYLILILCLGVSGVFFGISQLPVFSADEAPLVNITEIPEHLPYLAVPVRDFFVHHSRNAHLGNSAITINVDDDPALEIIRSTSRYLQCNEYSATDRTLHWQLNLDPEFYVGPDQGSAFGVSGPLDLNRDNPLVIVTGQTPSAHINRFWLVEPQTGSVLNTFDISGGDDRNDDGRWDGAFAVIGDIDIPCETGLRKAVILVCKVGFDLDMRGIFAVDPWTGETIWSFTSGISLLRNSCHIVDLDGDGAEEIIAASLAPCNMGDNKINGFGDDKSYIIALDTDGTLLWYDTLAEKAASSRLKIGDLDGDGTNEFISISNYIYAAGGSIAAWSPGGELLASYESDEHLNYGELLLSPDSNHVDIFSGNRENSIFKISLNSGELSLTKEATNPATGLSIIGTVNLPKDQGQGIVTLDREGVGRVLNHNLDIVASYEEDEPAYSREAISTLQDNQPAFLAFRSNLGTVVLKPNPDTALALAFKRITSNSRWVLLSGLALGIALAWIFWNFARRNNKPLLEPALPSSNNPTQLQERRLHLLEDLEISNHGAMAPLRSLRRLLWMLDAVNSGVGVNPPLVARLNEIWQDCHDDALPRLSNILERARLSQISDLLVTDALSSIDRINNNLAELKNNSFEEKAVAQYLGPLHKEEKTSEAMLQSLRRQVGEHFQAPLSAVLDKVLRANQHCIEENEVVVQKGMVGVAAAGSDSTELPVGDTLCRMDADELGFILDNLVDNACRAMASSPKRNLRITWHSLNGLVKIEIADTGLGIATEDHQKVMETGYSTRPGGGLGLPKSQRLLRKYGGHLSVQSSDPGKGTTFSLIVPRT